MESFDYTLKSRKGFDEAVEAVIEKSKERGFGVLHIHDVKDVLAKKGYPRDPLKIIEICNPGYANRVLDADIKTSLMLPCPISVYVESGQVFISAMRPRAIADFFPGAGIKALAEEVDAIIRTIVDEAG
jgi:uncharacterized protein (DUF302 family)